MVAPLSLAMMSMMPGMMPGMGAAMGAGAMAGGAMGGGLGKGMGNLLGFGNEKSDSMFGGQKPKDIKFDKVTISSVEIKDVSIGNLTIDSTDKKEKDDFDKAEEDKGKVVDKTITSDLEQEGTLTEKGFIGGMEDSFSSPMEGMSDSNEQLNEVLTGKSSLGGGFPELTDDTGDMTGSLDTIADNTKVLEDMFNWQNKDKKGESKGILESIFDGLNDFLKNVFSGAWKVITDLARASWTVIEGIAKASWTVIEGFAQASWAVIKFSITTTLDALQKLSQELARWTAVGIEALQAASEEAARWLTLASTEAARWTELAAVVGIKVGVAAFDAITGFGIEIGKAVAEETRRWVELALSGFTKIVDTLADTMVKAASSFKEISSGLAAMSDSARGWFDSIVGVLGFGPDTNINVTMDTSMIHTAIATLSGGVSLRTMLEELQDMKQVLIDGLGVKSPGYLHDLVSIQKEDKNHTELRMTVAENIAERALSTPRPGRDSSGKMPQTRQSQPFSDRDFSSRAEQESSGRGMTPSYTKAPPPPRGMSQKTVEEMRSYLKFPVWRTRMG